MYLLIQSSYQCCKYTFIQIDPEVGASVSNAGMTLATARKEANRDVL
jgi:hypothetical protein